MKEYVRFFGLVVIVGASWYADQVFATTNSHNFYLSALSGLLIFIFFNFFLKRTIIPRISDWKQRYLFRKTAATIRVTLLLAILFAIWIENVQALFVAYGVLGAGLAVALQDAAKNTIGGLMLMTQGLYKAGDRIEVAGIVGDVIDVSLFYTTVLEIQVWVKGDQTTGRLVSLPNKEIINSSLKNYTKDNTILWDEISVPLTYESNWKKALKEIAKLVAEKTAEDIKMAEKDITTLSSKYYLSTRDATPTVYVSMTDNWINLDVRYVTEVRKRRNTHSLISQAILDWINTQKDVTVASETISILKK